MSGLCDILLRLKPDMVSTLYIIFLYIYTYIQISFLNVAQSFIYLFRTTLNLAKLAFETVRHI